ncbi:protein-L-isoaspartate O-methyltransferase [Candidatus Shapirobacteria bacterium CG09_land_8_20_14_0_10_49_15]|uniref:Protein-L-isoaspartate O-methyltransferase n=1 Tax=Candidatus Shapirobacteria bacterium CG09_land_8_20_14_0_10_49_15 TaxID=1974482 RepID=A0A2M6XAU3_9BACT|nr:MAG: protein-L-isoaspartate O-methyltransferase [Candidatus Shapirobacteria bacterium CG09_land_8_20_14_0_10_49_15]
MSQYNQWRTMMVEQQLKARGITDKKILKVMGEIPREKFVPVQLRDQAYNDYPLAIGFGQTISQPYVVALMCQLLELKGDEKVLDVGTGSGYQAAVLSRLAKQVVTIEKIARLAKSARVRLKKLGFNNVRVVSGNGYQGYFPAAPYEAIKAAAAVSAMPLTWAKQLKMGGRMVFPLGQELVKISKQKNRLVRKNYGGVTFVPLIDKEKRPKAV